jgi:hypothetical protein
LGIQQLYQQHSSKPAGFGAVKTLLIPKYQHADGGAIPTLGNGVINNGANVVPPSMVIIHLHMLDKVKLFLTNNNKH